MTNRIESPSEIVNDQFRRVMRNDAFARRCYDAARIMHGLSEVDALRYVVAELSRRSNWPGKPIPE